MADTTRFLADIIHGDCSYLARENSVCNKCGNYVKSYVDLKRELTALISDLELLSIEKGQLKEQLASLCEQFAEMKGIIERNSIPLP